jgi:hypothetical protein
VLERVQQRLDQDPNKMTLRRQTAEHPFGTIKGWMGATHFLMRGRRKVATEMALNVLAYNTKRVIAILGCRPLLQDADVRNIPAPQNILAAPAAKRATKPML